MIFVDTSAWLAQADSHDRDHEAARAVGRRLAKGEFGKQVTTNYVMVETVTLLRRHLGMRAAISFEESVRTSDEVRVFWIEPVHHAEALRLMAERADKEWSVTDCTSFIVMKALEISAAFTLDADFAQAGFSPVP